MVVVVPKSIITGLIQSPKYDTAFQAPTATARTLQFSPSNNVVPNADLEKEDSVDDSERTNAQGQDYIHTESPDQTQMERSVVSLPPHSPLEELNVPPEADYSLCFASISGSLDPGVVGFFILTFAPVHPALFALPAVTIDLAADQNDSVVAFMPSLRPELKTSCKLLYRLS